MRRWNNAHGTQQPITAVSPKCDANLQLIQHEQKHAKQPNLKKTYNWISKENWFLHRPSGLHEHKFVCQRFSKSHTLFVSYCCLITVGWTLCEWLNKI